MAVKYFTRVWFGWMMVLYFAAGALLFFVLGLLDHDGSTSLWSADFGRHVEGWAMVVGYLGTQVVLAIVCARHLCVWIGAYLSIVGIGAAGGVVTGHFGLALAAALVGGLHPLALGMYLGGGIAGSLTVSLVLQSRRRGVRPRGQCPSCGCSLTGLTPDKCPECGKPVDPAYWSVAAFKKEQEPGRGEPG